MPLDPPLNNRAVMLERHDTTWFVKKKMRPMAHVLFEQIVTEGQQGESAPSSLTWVPGSRGARA